MPLPALGLIFAPAKIMGMLSGAAGFVLKYWKQIIVLGMAATIFHQNFMEWEALKWVGVRTIPGITQEYQYQIGVLEEQLQECELSRAELKGQIESVNQQIDQWADVSQQQQQQFDELTAQIEKMREQSSQEVEAILAGPTPESCAGAIQLLRESAQGDLKWRE